MASIDEKTNRLRTGSWALALDLLFTMPRHAVRPNTATCSKEVRMGAKQGTYRSYLDHGVIYKV